MKAAIIFIALLLLTGCSQKELIKTEVIVIDRCILELPDGLFKFKSIPIPVIKNDKEKAKIQNYIIELLNEDENKAAKLRIINKIYKDYYKCLESELD